MLRTSIIAAVCALAVPLLLAGTSGASTSAGTPQSAGISVSMPAGPSGPMKRESHIHITIGVGTNKTVHNVTVRAYLPGLSIVGKPLVSVGTFDIKTSIWRTPGGISWRYSLLPHNLGFSAEIDAKVVAPIGAQRCSQVVVTAGGKSMPWKLGCFRVVR